MLFSYDEDGHLLGEYASNGDLIQETIWLGDTPIATIRPNSESHNGQVTGSVKAFFIQPDHLDTPRTIVDNNNQAIWQWHSDPFGKALPNADVDGDSVDFVFNLRFPGQYFDSETGTHYNYFRDYEAQTGRYLQSDPIGLDGGINTFFYVGNDSINYSDSFGLIRFKPKPKRRKKPAPIKPDKRKGMWNCAVVACCKTIGNCSEENQKCRQAVWAATNKATAIKLAEALAKTRAACQVKHVTVKCTGPKGEHYTRGG